MALPPHPYLMATAGDKRYPMPSGLNQLLLDNGLTVTDRNMLDLAKIFVTLAVGNDGYAYPKVAFMEATRTSEVMDGTPYQARLQVRVGEQIEDWYFGVLESQLSFVARRGAKGLIKNYLPTVVEPLPVRGQLNSPTPRMAIDTSGHVLVQYDDSLHPHYYLIAKENGSPTIQGISGTQYLIHLGAPRVQRRVSGTQYLIALDFGAGGV
ncbi:MAG: hypothetical protein E4H37_08185 [Gemmatimonadales bacterium]|nr:MAG: hypothetical protein E4H37_08185 [Gemmatimonadales bacterium]